MQQGSDEWFQARLGKVTASRVADVIATTRSGPAASRANYLAELVLERLTGEVAPHFTTAAMQHGIDTEPEAVAAYSFRHDVDAIESGFVEHPTIPNTGASPDRLIGEDGLVEVKCPQPAAHLIALTGQAVPSRHLTQMQWQMACTGRAWCDYVSYSPAFPEAMHLFVKRVERDDAAIASMEAHVVDFLGEVDETVAKLRALYEREAA
jgi:putative phage-type endonuclease